MEDQFKNLLDELSQLAEDAEVKNMKLLLRDKLAPRKRETCTTLRQLFDAMLQHEFISPSKVEEIEDMMSKVFSRSENKEKVSELFRYYADYCRSETQPKDCQPAAVDNTPESPPLLVPATVPSKVTTEQTASSKDGTTHDQSLSTGNLCSISRVPTNFTTAFKYTADRIANDWISFAMLALGDVFDSSVSDIKRNRNLSSRRKALQVFVLWYNHTDMVKQRTPTLTEFRKYLRKIPRNDIADSLKANAHGS